MTPAARYAAAITVLDHILDGTPAEKALLAWARGSRFAGSKDRAAVRDHVFDVLRKKRSLAELGGGDTGRALILGLLRDHEMDPQSIFTGTGYAPTALSDEEQAHLHRDVTLSDAQSANLPDDLWPFWCDSLGEAALDAAQAAQERGPVTIRLATQNATREQVIAALAQDDIEANPHPTCATAAIITKNPRRLAQSSAFTNGWFELQDAASQIAMTALDLTPGARVLDYCAGGGGKALALANLKKARVTAHDINIKRMADIPDRAARAGVIIDTCETDQLGQLDPFDLVLVDAPCSGSGTWRRAPDMKWRTDAEMVKNFAQIQLDVLENAKSCVATKGTLAYATCSVFQSENQAVVDQFLAQNAGWVLKSSLSLIPDTLQDGFYLAQLYRS